MNDITPVGQSRAAALGRPNAHSGRGRPTATSASREADRVELSKTAQLTAQLLDQLKSIPGVRTEVIQRVKDEIANGKYLTPEKIDASIDPLLEDLS